MTVAVWTGCVPPAAREKSPEATVFVAPSGDDANPGTRERPVATPRGAQGVARKLLAAGQPAVVEFADGTYRLERPLSLTAADSGTSVAPVVWRAANRGKAVFTASVALDGWKDEDDPTALKLLPEAAHGKVKVTAVPGNGPLPSFRCSTYGTGKDAGLPMALFAGDERLPCAYGPNDDFFRTGRVHAEKIGLGERAAKEGSFAFRREKLADWVREPFPWAYGMWGVEWSEDSAPLDRIDVEKGLVTLSPASFPYGLRRCKPFRVFNAFCELDRPGEWVVDVARRRIHLWPVAGNAPGVPQLVVSDGFVEAKGAHDVVFDGLVFEKCRKTALSFRDCERVTVRASVVRHTCSWGVDVRGGRDCRVVGCDLYDLGEGGIRLEGGDKMTLTPANHVAENCHIRDYGKVLHNYREGVALYGVGNRAVHNLIHHSAHTGVYYRGNDHYVGYNVVHDTCEYNDDAGAIYVWQYSWSMRGGVIEHNIVHMTGKKRYPNNTEGIYLDDFTSEVKVRGNLVVRATRGIHCGGGKSHELTDNVFVNCDNPICLGSRINWPDAKKGPEGGVWKELQKDLPTYSSPLWTDRYPGLAKLLDYPDRFKMYYGFWNTVTGNVFAACGEPVRSDWNVISNTTVWADNAAVAGDPGFRDYAGLDWTGAADAAFRSKIDGLRFAEAGLYDSPDRITPAVKFGADVTPPPAFGARSLALPKVNLAISLSGELPKDVRAFAEKTVDCEVPGWSKGRWIFDVTDCNPDENAPWEDFSFSFVPTCDCTVKFVAMGGNGVKTLYDAVEITGATWEGSLFEKPQPVLGNEKERTISKPVRLSKGVPVSVAFKAKSAGEEK